MRTEWIDNATRGWGGATLISSQKYLDDDVVAEKLRDEDWTIYVSPTFEIDGLPYRVLMDGHHSLAAAVEADQEPAVVVMDSRMSDRLLLLEEGSIEQFLEAEWMDDDWYDVATGKDVF